MRIEIVIPPGTPSQGQWRPGPRRTLRAEIAIGPAPPCKFLGDELTGYERSRLSLSLEKKWHYCDHAGKPLGDVVCPCRGCGPSCRGYQKES